MRRAILLLSCSLLLALTFAVEPTAQSKPTLKPADYDQFESVSPGSALGGLSPDGKWLAYTITKVGGDSELRIAQVGGTTTKTVPFGTGASFSMNSQWIAYGIGQSEAEAERLRTARQPVQRKLGLLNLATNTETITNGIESFSFDRTGQSLAMKRYAPAPAGGAAPAPAAPAAPAGRGGAAAPPAAGVGTTLMVRNLATGADTTFGNVTEYQWQVSDTGRLLAMVISAEGQAGNGVHLFNADTSVLRVLESSAADYSSLTWREDSSDLVALKSKLDEKRDGPTQVALVWTSIGQSSERLVVLDPTANNALPASQRIVNFRRPSWLVGSSASGLMIVLGVADWAEKPAPANAGRGAGRGNAAPAPGATPPAGGAPAQTAPPTPAANEKPDVDVWHWNDTTVMSAQKISLAADRRRNLPAVWHVATNKLVVVGKSFNENVSPIRGTTQALVSDATPYLMERSIGRGANDISLADLVTGARTPLKTRVAGNVTASTGGKFAIYADGGHYWTIDLATKAVTNLTAGLKTSFVDIDSDSTAPQKPMFGSGGWTKDDEAVVLYDKFDAWKVSPSGKGATRLTNGASEQVRHRILNVGGRPGEPINLTGAWVTLFGTASKKSGYGRLDGNGTASRVIWLDKSVAGLAKADKSDVFSYSVQGADDSPDLFVGGPDLTTAKQMTTTNAFLTKYAWTRAELVDFTVVRGKQKIPLQGILHYPANYEPGRKYPMVVYLYERLSDGLHRFTNPSERDYYNGMALTQNGYFYFQPDIVFAPREPGVSVVECVTAAVNKVVSMGAVDATKVGVMGHSWGGFDAMYLATHSKIFAAAVSGAGIANLISNYGNGHWSSGIAETDHIETGQQRMVVPLYEDLQAYIRNSAVFGISTMTTPLLLMTGDNDGTVFWHQSVELYNIARRAKKNVVMLVYNGEDHGLRVKKNQVDYHRRIQAWFDHYLKGNAAEKWITEGVKAIDK